MDVQLIIVPYDSGHRNMRMGAGPLHLIDRGLPAALRAVGAAVHLSEIAAPDAFNAENQTAFALNRLIAAEVRRAREQRRFPLICAGNCNSANGVIAGLTGAETGAIWFDAHGDFNTPEASESGFLDGMALAILEGSCWQRLAASVPGFQPLPGPRIVHIGGRDYSEGEHARMVDAGVNVIAPRQLDQRRPADVLSETINSWDPGEREIYLHLDLDVIDSGALRANQFAAPGGLFPAQVLDMIGWIRSRFTIAAASLTAYDPSFDDDDRAVNTAIDLARAVVSGVTLNAQQPPPE